MTKANVDGLLARIEEARWKVRDGKLDLHPIGEALFGKWDQDYLAQTLELAAAALATAAPQGEREDERLEIALREIDRQVARNAHLIAAIRPFAEFAEGRRALLNEGLDDSVFYGGSTGPYLTRGDFRQALIAYNQPATPAPPAPQPSPASVAAVSDKCDCPPEDQKVCPYEECSRKPSPADVVERLRERSGDFYQRADRDLDLEAASLIEALRNENGELWKALGNGVLAEQVRRALTEKK